MGKTGIRALSALCIAGLTTVGVCAVHANSHASGDQTLQVAGASAAGAYVGNAPLVPEHLKRNKARYENQPVVDASLEKAVHDKRQQLVRECMAERGVHLSNSQSAAPAAINNELLGGKLDSNGVPATRRVYVNPALAASQGYSLTSGEIAEERARRKALVASANAGDLNHSGVDAAVSSNSCTAQANTALFGDSKRFASVEMNYVNRTSLSIASLNSDPAYAKAREAYRACMADAGFSNVRAPGFGVHQALSMRIERGDAALQDERKLAQADVTCEASATFYQTKKAAEDRMLSAGSSSDQGKIAVAEYETMLRQAINK